MLSCLSRGFLFSFCTVFLYACSSLTSFELLLKISDLIPAAGVCHCLIAPLVLDSVLPNVIPVNYTLCVFKLFYCVALLSFSIWSIFMEIRFYRYIQCPKHCAPQIASICDARPCCLNKFIPHTGSHWSWSVQEWAFQPWSGNLLVYPDPTTWQSQLTISQFGLLELVGGLKACDWRFIH